MKYTLFLSLLFINTWLLGQVPPGYCGINFSYDAGGNRVQRYVCSNTASLVAGETNQAGALQAPEAIAALTTPSDEDMSQLILFPNPAVDHFQIAAQINMPAESEVWILDASGKAVLQSYLSAGRFEIGALPFGTYMVLVQHGQTRKTALLIRTPGQ